MLIIGCDYHPGFQQIAFVDTESGELGERRLLHREEAEQFYREFQGQKVRVGMEASGHARWFERLLRDLQFELWIGDAAEIRTKRVPPFENVNLYPFIAKILGLESAPNDGNLAVLAPIFQTSAK